jgi:glycine/D-amino acid oxidase-like deaminating enzyme
MLNSSNQYDYIIAGAGCAGLSLAVHMIHSGKFSNKKILIKKKKIKMTAPGAFGKLGRVCLNRLYIKDGNRSGFMEINFQNCFLYHHMNIN